MHTYRKIGQSFVYADYSKIALGFVQLASMCRLAIEIRFSVYHLLRHSQVTTDSDSVIDLQKVQISKRSYRKYLLLTTIVCSIGAAFSMICAIWLTVVLYNFDNSDYYDLQAAADKLICGD